MHILVLSTIMAFKFIVGTKRPNLCAVDAAAKCDSN